MGKIALILAPGVVSPAEALARACGLTAVSVGDLFREHVHRRTAAGLRFQRYIRDERPVPAQMVEDIVEEALAGAPGGWVLSGFPRTISQAEMLTRIGCEPDSVIELALAEEQISQDWRLARERETIASLQASYHEAAGPLRARYLAAGVYRAGTGTGIAGYEQMASQLIALVLNGQESAWPSRFPAEPGRG
ncbi:nucleoside monophosphate kinase [Longispora albida]|uniref:nucleoside monophosphate kinase n=1 Tax=Longispora albida TaxID=203523 RepID=UPI00039D21C5|nr:nucleoside monophosphate kinase [Longispora albida]